MPSVDRPPCSADDVLAKIKQLGPNAPDGISIAFLKKKFELTSDQADALLHDLILAGAIYQSGVDSFLAFTSEDECASDDEYSSTGSALAFSDV